MTKEQADYLAGWAEAARVGEQYKRDAADARCSIVAQRATRSRPMARTNWDHEDGYADGALAAFGHGDTDAARSSAFVSPGIYS